MSRWPMGLAIGLLVVVLVNGAMLWVALQDPPQIEESYRSATR